MLDFAQPLTFSVAMRAMARLVGASSRHQHGQVIADDDNERGRRSSAMPTSTTTLQPLTLRLEIVGLTKRKRSTLRITALPVIPAPRKNILVMAEL